MPIQAFSFPIPETRFFHVGQRVYKFKIKRGSKTSGEEEMLDSEVINEELENAVRVILMCLDHLLPFTTQHFNIFPYKSRWERVSIWRFRKGEKELFAYPFLITLYVETNRIPPLTVNHAYKSVHSDRESRFDSPHLPTSCALPLGIAQRRNEKSRDGCLSSGYRYDKVDPYLGLRCWRCELESNVRPVNKECMPNLSEVAEEVVCGNQEYADSEETAPDEQNASGTKETEKPGVLSKLVSFAVFPFSLLFRRS